MKCREVKRVFVAYLDGEVMPSERTLIEAHLAGCSLCERELSALNSSRRRVADSLKTMAAQAAPSPQAWSHLQARLEEEVRTPPRRLTRWVTRPAPDEQPVTRSHRQGDIKMKLRWRIAFGTAGAIVLAAAVIAGVPSTRASAGNLFAHVFNIGSDTPMQLDYLPDGFESMPVFQTGSFVADTESDASGAVSSGTQEKQALYQNGDLFLLVKTSTSTDQALPEGQAAQVGALPAVLRTGLSGSLDAPGEPDSKAGGPTSGGENAEPGATVESGTSENQATTDDGPSLQSQGTGPEISPISYANANSLTWDADGTRVEILTNLPVEELLKIAQGLVLTD